MRRRAFVAFLLVAAIAIVWFVWQPFASNGPEQASGRHRSGQGNGGTGAGGSNPGTIVPGDNPIKHVIFIVKENRTFNNYFATYGHGAVGTTTGKTIDLLDLHAQLPAGR